MKNSYFFIVLIFCFSAFNIHKAVAQKYQFGVEIGTNFPSFYGQNVINSAHDGWSSISYKWNSRIHDFLLFNIKYAYYGANIVDKSAIYAQSSDLRFCTFELGYNIKSFTKYLDMSPYLTLDLVSAKNQGKYDGVGYGLGLKIQTNVWKGIVINLAPEYKYIKFDVQGSPEIIKFYNHTRLFNLSLGLGININA